LRYFTHFWRIYCDILQKDTYDLDHSLPFYSPHSQHIPKPIAGLSPPLWVLIWKNLRRLITLQKKEGFTMPKELLNKYRLTSMEEPTDEMLAQIMHEVAVEAKESTEKARKEYFEKLRQSIRESK